MPKKYYAVAVGRKTGVFESWDECKKQVRAQRHRHFHFRRDASKRLTSIAMRMPYVIVCCSVVNVLVEQCCGDGDPDFNSLEFTDLLLTL